MRSTWCAWSRSPAMLERPVHLVTIIGHAGAPGPPGDDHRPCWPAVAALTHAGHQLTPGSQATSSRGARGHGGAPGPPGDDHRPCWPAVAALTHAGHQLTLGSQGTPGTPGSQATQGTPGHQLTRGTRSWWCTWSTWWRSPAMLASGRSTDARRAPAHARLAGHASSRGHGGAPGQPGDDHRPCWPAVAALTHAGHQLTLGSQGTPDRGRTSSRRIGDAPAHAGSGTHQLTRSWWCTWSTW
jgi:hypothetical protein